MNYITLGDLLAIVETGSEFIRLTRADKFSAMLSDLDEATSYYSWVRVAQTTVPFVISELSAEKKKLLLLLRQKKL